MSDRDQKRAWRPTRSPQLEELKLFCTAAELGSVGRAARRLHITQPRASKRLHALEDLVGTPLFERSARGVTLTAAGERLYAHARRVAADVEELQDVIADIHGQRQAVRLAISHTAAEYLMPRAPVLPHHRAGRGALGQLADRQADAARRALRRRRRGMHDRRALRRAGEHPAAGG